MTDTKKPTAKKPVAKKPVAKKAAAPKKAGVGIDYLAKRLDTKPNLVRLKLRKAKIAKQGKSYLWATQAEADKVAAQLSK